MSHNNQKKIAVINDFTGFGKCSIAVSLPVISALKVQCCLVPTSIFSNHTAYPEYFFDDYTDKMEEYIDNWKKLGLEFEGISTGFLGDAKQIEIVKSFIRYFKKDNTVVIVDPVMGDYGVKYATYTEDLCRRMKELVEQADIVTPNITEACILTGNDYDKVINGSTIAMIDITLFVTGAFIINVTDGISLGKCLFETASAVGTVGLTLGITPQLGILSRIVLIILMFMGRVGGLTLIYAAFSGNGNSYSKFPEEKINIG